MSKQPRYKGKYAKYDNVAKVPVVDPHYRSDGALYFRRGSNSEGRLYNTVEDVLECRKTYDADMEFIIAGLTDDLAKRRRTKSYRYDKEGRPLETGAGSSVPRVDVDYTTPDSPIGMDDWIVKTTGSDKTTRFQVVGMSSDRRGEFQVRKDGGKRAGWWKVSDMKHAPAEELPAEAGTLEALKAQMAAMAQVLASFNK